MTEQESMARELAMLTVASDMAYAQAHNLREAREQLGIAYHDKYGKEPDYWPIYIDWFKRVRALVAEHAETPVPEARVAP